MKQIFISILSPVMILWLPMLLHARDRVITAINFPPSDPLIVAGLLEWWGGWFGNTLFPWWYHWDGIIYFWTNLSVMIWLLLEVQRRWDWMGKLDSDLCYN